MRFFGRRWLDYAAAPTIFAPANDLLVFSTASTNTITAVIVSKKYLQNVSLFIFFLVPPDPLVIFDETGKRRASVVGPYLVGDSIHLVCDAFGGKLLPFNMVLYYYKKWACLENSSRES